MAGKSTIVLSCVYLLAGTKLAEGMPLSYRQPFPPGKTPLLSMTPLGKSVDFLKEKLPPHLATLSELTEYKNLTTSSIRKTQLTLNGKKLNTLQLDDLLKAHIKRAVLPEPFTITVQMISVRFRGHFPDDSKTDVKCLVTYEWVTMSEDKIISPPLKFDCNKTVGLAKPTTAPTEIPSANVSPKSNSGSEPETKIVQLPKSFKKIKQVSRTTSVFLGDDEVSSKKPLASILMASEKPTVEGIFKTVKPTLDDKVSSKEPLASKRLASEKPTIGGIFEKEKPSLASVKPTIKTKTRKS